MMELLEVAMKASVILTFGLVTVALLRRRSAAVRHWVLAVAICCAAAAPIIGMLAPAWAVPPRPAVRPASATVAVTFQAAQPATAPDRDASRDKKAPNASAFLERASRFIVPVWLIGAALNLSVLLVGMSRLPRLRSSARPPTAAMITSLERVSQILGLARAVALVRSDRRAVLVTWGVLRPKVVLPADADRWPRERLDLVIAHELAHVIRGDWLVQTVAEIVKAVFWLNPLFWVACARLRHESECACDDTVLNIGVDGGTYAGELLDLARSFGRHGQQWLPAPAMAARPSNLERRVRVMLNPRIDRGPITQRGRWMFALALLVVTIPIATFAQNGFATFSGTLVDPQNRLLPGATIVVSDAQRNVKHETKTDQNGRFEIVGLPAGDYAVQASLPGFRNLTDALTVGGRAVDRTLMMQVGLLQETVSVVSDDGAITGSRTSGNVAQKRPNPACGTDAAVGPGGNIRPPHKVKDVRPGYPGVDGHVTLAATIGVDGTVTDVQVVKADRPELPAAAIDAVRQWEFDSTLLNCVPIEVQMNVDIDFRRNN